MIECLIYDETPDSNQYNDETQYDTPNSRVGRVRWTQKFSRVPCKGEYITKRGAWLKVEEVVWDEDRVRLAVKWDGRSD
ncbi:MAG: hypothetical protein HC860_16230 [Alkalinema sp. RU_4_3]|nr:hypothetical protein [Alkalinema sp. RU_4_3]